MSTYFFLQCEDHDPPIRTDRESGQHYYNLQQIFEDLDNRRFIEECNAQDIDPDDYYRRHTFQFLRDHPHCTITVWDEYDRPMTRDQAIEEGHYTPKGTPWTSE